MKRTDTLLKIASLLVFLAMAAYFGVYVVDRFIDPVQTALTVTATMSDSSTMSGLVVRDELVIKNTSRYIDVVVSDGEKVSAGQTVAVIYGSEEALSRASELAALSREIEDVEAALSRSGSAPMTGSRDGAIYDALRGISASVRGGGYTGADAAQSTLAGLVFRADTSDATDARLDELRASYDELSRSSVGDTRDVTVNTSGTFSTVVDGYEGVGPEYVRDLTPSELRRIIAADRVVDDDAIGKLVTSYSWYYAAIVQEADASRLVAGMTLRLSFGRYHNEYVTADVVFVGRAEGSEQLVLFRMDKGFLDMLAARAVSAELIYEEYTGLRVPLRGLYRYYAGYLSDGDAASLQEGQAVSLMLGGAAHEAFVSEIGSSQRYGDLPVGMEPGSEFDTRPTHRLVVFCWPWADEPPADDSFGGGTVTAGDGAPMTVTNYYDHEDGTDRMCVFAMTGQQAERKKVTLIYAGDEYCLVSSEGDDALREGNEVIVRATGLHNGKVFR